MPTRILQLQQQQRNRNHQVNEQAVTYDSLIKLGDEAYKQQKYTDAIDYYTKAVVFIPQDKLRCLKLQIYTSS